MKKAILATKSRNDTDFRREWRFSASNSFTGWSMCCNPGKNS